MWHKPKEIKGVSPLAIVDLKALVSQAQQNPKILSTSQKSSSISKINKGMLFRNLNILLILN